MERDEKRLERAVRLVPQDCRNRYEPEWRADFRAAQQEGIDAGAVSRGALRVARKRRLLQVGQVVLGRRGVGSAIAAWVVLLAMLGAAAMLGGVFLLGFLVFVVLAALAVVEAGSPTDWSHWTMVGSLLTGALAFAYVWWVAGVQINAADAMVPPPRAAAWGGLGLLVLLASFCGFVVSALYAARRAARKRAV